MKGGKGVGGAGRSSTPLSPLYWPLDELLRRYAERSLSPVEVTREALARIAAYDAQLGAYLTVTEQAALSQAANAEQAYARGEAAPLLGVPISIKDLFDVAGVRTTLGSLAHAQDVAPSDSPAVGRLRAAGAVFLGKTNTSEFGQS
ncbi:MAG TPA: amidase family protein, partial [Candidatus Dormibacteraeota bacterium]|nr:amidase family protein [Candidatus Dormibacteraeota bacterium]